MKSSVSKNHLEKFLALTLKKSNLIGISGWRKTTSNDDATRDTNESNETFQIGIFISQIRGR